MSAESTDQSIFEPALFVGTVAAVDPGRVRINLSEGGRPSSTLVGGSRHGLGVVGEFVVIEGEGTAQFGRIVEVRLPERERLAVETQIGRDADVHPIGTVQLLASVSLRNLAVQAGVEDYPRLGARVFAAPFDFISSISLRTGREGAPPKIAVHLGHLKDSPESKVEVTPERLFGRHCAVLGATGGGKSFSVARLAEECARLGGKAILLDPSGEYHSLADAVQHVHFGVSVDRWPKSTECALPYGALSEGDFIALFQPAGRTQGPKLRAAIRSLRLVAARPALATDGCLVKKGRKKADVASAEAKPEVAAVLESPRGPFDVSRLARQLREECVHENGGTFNAPDSSAWGNYDDGTYSYCLTLVSRINSILMAPELRCIFQPGPAVSVVSVIEQFAKSKTSVLRVSLEQLSFEFRAREIVANGIGRRLLELARTGAFKQSPMLVFLDEAHQFLNRTIGDEEYTARLDAFELIAKEGRKYGLNICLATQRPRDIPEGVLSQMGTLVVHRLTNDRDREVVERACGEIDKSASAFLPNLEPGEAALIGVDLAIPLTVQIGRPRHSPDSSGPGYQQSWSGPAEVK